MKPQPRSERKIGLARALSKQGYCSRSEAFGLIHAGRVRLNGRVVRDPEYPTRLPADKFEVDGREIEKAPRLYIAINKPRGIITSARDEKGRETVYSLLPDDLPWVGPVGRLDKASEGLLLLTNDSEWADRVGSPTSHIDKTYHVQISAIPQQALLDRLASGVRDRGELLRAKEIRVLRTGVKNSWLEIVLDEGKNRQIRRMMQACGVDVLRLIRVAIGGLALGTLQRGAWRYLEEAEKAALDSTMRSRKPGT